MKKIYDGMSGIVKVPNTAPDADAQLKIADLLNGIGVSVYDQIGNDEFWEWKNGGGSLPKRLAKYAKRKFGVKVNSDLLGQIGDIAGTYCSLANTYEYDIVSKFDWEAGDYGDYGSCFWGGNSCDRYYMQENGFYAFRLHRNGAGIARAWVCPYYIVPGNLAYVLFNGYGLCTLNMARIFSVVVGGYYTRVYIETYGYIYVNHYGRGYLIGDQDLVEDVERVEIVDEELDEEEDDEYYNL